MNRKALFLLFLLIILAAGLIGFWIQDSARKTAEATEQEAQAIQDVIVRGYTAFRESLRNGGDVSNFDEMFVNTADYRYENDEVFAFVARVFSAEEARHGGYLTAMSATYIAQGCAVQRMEEFSQAAKKANREVTPDERNAVKDACYGIAAPGLSDDPGIPKLDFKSIEINGDRAIARYDDGAALLEAILVRVNGRWFIANIQPIEVHF